MNQNLKKKSLYFFKNSDKFIFDLIKNDFLDISKYLNNKYNYLLINFIKRKELSLILFMQFIKRNLKHLFTQKKKIMLYSVDLFSFDSHKKWLKDKLKKKFIIKFNKNNPDYLIYNVFGSRHLSQKYNKSIKIAIYTENYFPDLNEADYAIGHYHISL